MLMRTFFSHIRVLIIVLLLLSTAAGPARAQFLQDGASGLMLAPSADMNPSGTFMITNTFLDPHVLPPFPWGYDTFGYSINITFWSRFEVSYVLTLMDGKRMENPPNAWWRAQNNQDRHFYAKFLLVKENEFGWKWVPAIAAGVSDPVTGAVNGEYFGSTDKIDNQNGYFNRFFVSASKHFNTPVGDIGTHIGYQYSFRTDRPVKGLCGGVNWRPKWLQSEMASLNLIGEYDSRTWNAGMVFTFYKNHFDLMFMLQNMQWVSWGFRYKIVLF